jgi:hypothetical protein
MAALSQTAEAPRALEIEIRGYQPRDRDRVLALIGRVWDEERRRNHEVLWDWKHARDGGAWGAGHLSRVIERRGEVVGYAGAIPARFLVDGEPVEGAFVMDTFVDPGARGIGLRLMRDRWAGAGFSVGAGNERARALWERVSGRARLVVRVARKMARVLDPAAILKQRGVPAPLAGALGRAHAGTRALLGRGARAAPGAAGLVLEPVERFPEAIDALGLEFARGFRRSVLRDRCYLDWRFVAGPARYCIRLLRGAGGHLRGYVVYRPARINGRPAVLLIEMLAIGERAPAYRAMLSHVEEEARACGAGEIQTLDPGCPILAAEMLRLGYFRRPEPHHILGYQAGPPGEASDFADPGTWYVALGDADFEHIFFNQGVSSGLAAGDPSAMRAT